MREAVVYELSALLRSPILHDGTLWREVCLNRWGRCEDSDAGHISRVKNKDREIGLVEEEEEENQYIWPARSSNIP